MERDSKQTGRRKTNSFKTNMIILLILIVVVTCFPQLRGGASTSLTFEGDTLVLTAPDQEPVTVKYHEIVGLELAELEQPGTLIDGGENRTYAWGEWETAEFGRCTLYVSKRIDTVICITTEDQKIVVNRENEKTTAAIYEAILELI